MFGGPIRVSSREGSEWQEIQYRKYDLGKTNIVNQSGRSNEAPKQCKLSRSRFIRNDSSIENNQQHRCNGKLALHVLDTMDTTINCFRKKIKFIT